MVLNRLQKKINELEKLEKKALVSYIVAGDPDQSSTPELMHALVDSGTDIIELGVPFSDPSAEGPTIQLAHERALENHIGLGKVFDIVKEFRKTDADTPIVLMGYANPIEWMGYEPFCELTVGAGADAVLVVDIPPEEAEAINSVLIKHDLLNVFLIAPTTSKERVEQIAGYANGFLYYVSLKGVTGSGSLDIDSVESKVNQIRAHTELPIFVGFGIKTPDHAAAVSKVADGVVVGSAFVDLLATKDHKAQALSTLASDLRQAIDS